MEKYETNAVFWSHAEKKISLNEWIKGSSILVLGIDESVRQQLDALNKLIFKRVTELLLQQSDSDTRKTWIFIDEAREAGKLDGLSSLLTRGRSKGVCVALGFQDIEGLRSVYGSKVAHEILGQCGNSIVLRTEGQETAEWAAKLFGVREVSSKRKVSNYSGGTGMVSGKKGYSLSADKSIKKNVLPSDIMSITPPRPEVGLWGFAKVRGVGIFSFHIPGKRLAERLGRISEERYFLERRLAKEQVFESMSGKVELPSRE